MVHIKSLRQLSGISVSELREAQDDVSVRLARDYVQSNFDSLKRKYGDNYIAVLGKEGVIGYDADGEKLASQIRESTHLRRLVVINTIEGIIDGNIPTPIMIKAGETQ